MPMCRKHNLATHACPTCKGAGSIATFGGRTRCTSCKDGPMPEVRQALAPLNAHRFIVLPLDSTKREAYLWWRCDFTFKHLALP